jgi:serine/threonine-protein kinase RsbW
MPRPGCGLRLSGTIAARLEEAERACADLRSALSDRLSKTDLFAVELMFREMLTNSVCHGCSGNQDLSVSYLVSLSDRTLSISVEDEGAGFDWRSRKLRRPDPRDTCGRGLSILGAYAQEVRFNDAGNRVEIVRALEANKGYS